MVLRHRLCLFTGSLSSHSDALCLRSYAQMFLPFRGHSYLRLHSSVVYASSRGHYLPTQMPVCSFNQPLKILFMAAFFRRPTPSFLFGQALDLLVTVSSMCYHTSTSALSTSSSSRGLTGLTPGISYLKGGFTLRCLQRLSLPDLATLLCHWYDNRYTSGPSSPVLSY